MTRHPTGTANGLLLHNLHASGQLKEAVLWPGEIMEREIVCARGKFLGCWLGRAGLPPRSWPDV